MEKRHNKGIVNQVQEKQKKQREQKRLERLKAYDRKRKEILNR